MKYIRDREGTEFNSNEAFSMKDFIQLLTVYF